MAEVNVRVAVRVRPLLQKEKLAGEEVCVQLKHSTKQVIIGKDRVFTFNDLLNTKSTQEEVYKCCVDQLVQSCFEGYNCTVFAYGQTGSGKTYTIGGGNMTAVTEEEIGIIPRALRHMYSIMQANHSREYSVKVSYIEIYREELQDLLDPDNSTKDLHIREDDKGNTLIMGATEYECRTLDDVMSCLQQGSAYRHTASTQMNEQSSRSHSVFTVLIEQRWDVTDTTPGHRQRLASEESEIIEDSGELKHYMCGKFHFVDLAGSERAHKTGNVGERFKESVHINSGLLALGNVISALGDTKRKVTHIPYRDAKITRLLKDSLGGNAKTVMICCISPTTANFDETLNALKYANRAKNIKNKPIVNRDIQSIRFEEMETEIKALREELEKQRTTLFSAVTPMTEVDMQKVIQDAEQVRELEAKIKKMQTECSHYQMLVEDAHKQLRDIQGRDVLSNSQTVRLGDWLELMEEIKNNVPSTLSREQWDNQTIRRLESEVQKYKNDLANDEEIFAQKNLEVQDLQNRIAELEAANEELSGQLEDACERQKQQEQQLVEKGIQLEELAAKLKESEAVQSSQVYSDSAISARTEKTEGLSSNRSDGPPTSSRRAKSVPAQALAAHDNQRLHVITPRNIHTSPATVSLERVMQNFRARSQLLAARAEEADDVAHQEFSDDSTEEEEEAEQEFERSGFGRRTYKVRKPHIRPRINTKGDQGDKSRKTQKEGENADMQRTRTITKSPRPLKSIIKGQQQQPEKSTKGSLDASRLRCSTEIQRKRLKQTQIQVQQSALKMRDLSINIRMKEELIKELVKSGKETSQLNQEYEMKIKALEVEKQETDSELVALQQAMQELEANKQRETAEKIKLQSEFSKKLEVARSKMSALQRKQRETERMANITATNDKRIVELEQAVDRMKQQQDLLQKRLKEEVDRKAKLEIAMQKEQARVKELEERTQQQQKVLKVKTDQVAAAQKKLRTGTLGSAASGFSRNISKPTNLGSMDDPNHMEDQRRWMDAEVEKVLEQRRQMEELEQELRKREEVLAKKEALLSQRSELEMKKLRSSQILNKDILTVSTKLEAVERQLDEKKKELRSTSENDVSSIREAIKGLQSNRDKLRKQRQVLDDKLHDGSILSPQDERRLIEFDEAIEALDAAIEYKNQVISSRQEMLRKSQMLHQDEGSLVYKLSALSVTETRSLLARYFEKVIDLRECERQRELTCSELEMKCDEQERLIQEMEASLQRHAFETDRRLTAQQQEHERKLQVLMQQLREQQAGGAGVSNASTDQELEARVKQLEKDLYYYKKTSRELKKKLREVMSSITGASDADRDLYHDTPRDRQTTPRTPNGQTRDQEGRKSSHRSWYDSGIPQYSGSQSARTEGGHWPMPDMPLSARTDKHSNLASVGPMSSRLDDSVGYRSKSVRGVKSEGATDGRLVTPVKISKSNLRQMTEEEVIMRKSQSSQGPGSPQDSLELGKNPWK